MTTQLKRMFTGIIGAEKTVQWLLENYHLGVDSKNKTYLLMDDVDYDSGVISAEYFKWNKPVESTLVSTALSYVVADSSNLAKFDYANGSCFWIKKNKLTFRFRQESKLDYKKRSNQLDVSLSRTSFIGYVSRSFYDSKEYENPEHVFFLKNATLKGNNLRFGNYFFKFYSCFDEFKKEHNELLKKIKLL